ncbi:hypothetical protein GE278_15595 [Enterobacteriaceae bacterium Kacie_13]|nr:hypothetical protein GE278_15595 [Enterobacteriaceae bacterium Kacie_13]
MQKWKLILSALLALSFVSQVADAEDNVPANAASAKSPQPEALPTPVQDHMIEMMQDDFSFENQKRVLSNELELEQLRAAIQKAKGISTPVAEPVIAATTQAGEAAPESAPDENKMEEAVALPKVLLVSEIAGISRVAVSDNDVVKLVKINEKFTMNGHQFLVYNTGQNMPSVKEVTQ